jgi:hypothetical protein
VLRSSTTTKHTVGTTERTQQKKSRAPTEKKTEPNTTENRDQTQSAHKQHTAQHNIKNNKKKEHSKSTEVARPPNDRINMTLTLNLACSRNSGHIFIGLSNNNTMVKRSHPRPLSTTPLVSLYTFSPRALLVHLAFLVLLVALVALSRARPFSRTTPTHTTRTSHGTSSSLCRCGVDLKRRTASHTINSPLLSAQKMPPNPHA